MNIWRPCVSASPCESCREPISPGAWVYHGEVVKLFWCAGCTFRRLTKLPPAEFEPLPVRTYLAPKPAKAELRAAQAEAPVAMRLLRDVGRDVADKRDWAKAAAKDDE